MENLKVYFNDNDWVVASSEEDAWAVWCENTGEKREDFEDDFSFDPLPDTHVLSMGWDEGDDEPALLTMTCQEWTVKCGRGFLGSWDY